MRCPRCKSYLADPETVYCLKCGKKLRAAPSVTFGEEFEGEFRYDEELAEEAFLREEQEALKRQEQKRRFAVILSICFTVCLALFVLLLFLLRPTKPANDYFPGETPQADVADKLDALTEEESLALKAKTETLMRATCTDYDLDTMLSLVAPAARETVCTMLMQDYNVQTEEALKEVFLREADANAIIFSDTVCTFTKLNTEQCKAVEAELLTRFGTTFGTITSMVRADVRTLATRDAATMPQEFSYLFCEVDGTFYTFDF